MEELLIKFKAFEAEMFKVFEPLPMDLRQTLEEIERYILYNAPKKKI